MKETRNGMSEMEVNKMIEGSLYLELAVTLSLDARELIDDYRGRLILRTSDGNYNLGKVQYFIVRVNDMLEKGYSPIWELDGLDTDTADYCELFLGEDYSWSKAVCQLYPDARFGDLAILNRLVVNPPFRGHGIGLHCIEKLTCIGNGVSLFILRPAPLQYSHGCENDPDVGRKAGNEKADRKKLVTYYKKAGFRVVPGTAHMALDPQNIKPATASRDFDGYLSFQRTEAMEAFWMPNPETEARSTVNFGK